MSEPLSELLAALPEGQGLALGDILEGFGSRAHGTAILLLALPDAIPLPVPSVGGILGIPLALISLHLFLFGGEGHLPGRLSRWRLPPRGVSLLKRRVAPLLARAERISQPRLGAIAARQRLVGLVCLVLSVVLLLPIPFMNTPPSLCLALLAWGIIQRDGVFVLAGFAFTAGLGLGLTFLVERMMALIA